MANYYSETHDASVPRSLPSQVVGSIKAVTRSQEYVGLLIDKYIKTHQFTSIQRFIYDGAFGVYLECGVLFRIEKSAYYKFGLGTH
jgi:hypothetical protein